MVTSSTIKTLWAPAAVVMTGFAFNVAAAPPTPITALEPWKPGDGHWGR